METSRRESFRRYATELVNSEDIEEIRNLLEYASGLIIKNQNMGDYYETQVSENNSNVYIKACYKVDNYNSVQRENIKKMYEESNKYYKELLDNYGIDPLVSRTANDYDILTSINKYDSTGAAYLEDYQEELFLKSYEEALFYYNKVTRTKSFQNEDMFREFSELYLIFMAIQRYITKRMSNQFDVDTFTKYQCKNYFISNGVDYFDNLPLTMQKRLIKLLNDLQLNKGDDLIFDYIKQVLGTDNINIYKYVLARFGNNYDDSDDLDFYKVPYDENLNPKTNELYDFDSITGNDPYWRAEKNEILQASFNTLDTKYISVEYMVNLLSNSYSISYFFYLLNDLELQNKTDEQVSSMAYYNTDISTDKIKVYDAMIAMLALFLRYINNSDTGDDFNGDPDSDGVSPDQYLMNIYGYNDYSNNSGTYGELKEQIIARAQELIDIYKAEQAGIDTSNSDNTELYYVIMEHSSYFEELITFINEEFSLLNLRNSGGITLKSIVNEYYNTNTEDDTNVYSTSFSVKEEFLQLADYVRFKKLYISSDSITRTGLYYYVENDLVIDALDYLKELIFSGMLNIEYIYIHQRLKHLFKNYLVYLTIEDTIVKTDEINSEEVYTFNESYDMCYNLLLNNTVIFNELRKYVVENYGYDNVYWNAFISNMYSSTGPMYFVKMFNNLDNFYMNEESINKYRNFKTYIEVCTNFKKLMYSSGYTETLHTTALNSYSSIASSEFSTIFNNNESMRKRLEYFITECPDKMLYDLLRILWTNKFKSDLDMSLYNEVNYFSDYLMNNNEDLYLYINNIESDSVDELTESEKRSIIEDKILQLAEDIESYCNTEGSIIYNSTFNLVYTKMKYFAQLLIDVFKAYTLDTIYADTTFDIDDKYSNNIKLFDNMEIDEDSFRFDTYEYMQMEDGINRSVGDHNGFKYNLLVQHLFYVSTGSDSSTDDGISIVSDDDESINYNYVTESTNDVLLSAIPAYYRLYEGNPKIRRYDETLSLEKNQELYIQVDIYPTKYSTYYSNNGDNRTDFMNIYPSSLYGMTPQTAYWLSVIEYYKLRYNVDILSDESLYKGLIHDTSIDDLSVYGNLLDDFFIEQVYISTSELSELSNALEIYYNENLDTIVDNYSDILGADTPFNYLPDFYINRGGPSYLYVYNKPSTGYIYNNNDDTIEESTNDISYSYSLEINGYKTFGDGMGNYILSNRVPYNELRENNVYVNTFNIEEFNLGRNLYMNVQMSDMFKIYIMILFCKKIIAAGKNDCFDNDISGAITEENSKHYYRENPDKLLELIESTNFSYDYEFDYTDDEGNTTKLTKTESFKLGDITGNNFSLGFYWTNADTVDFESDFFKDIGVEDISDTYYTIETVTTDDDEEYTRKAFKYGIDTNGNESKENNEMTYTAKMLQEIYKDSLANLRVDDSNDDYPLVFNNDDYTISDILGHFILLKTDDSSHKISRGDTVKIYVFTNEPDSGTEIRYGFRFIGYLPISYLLLEELYNYDNEANSGKTIQKVFHRSYTGDDTEPSISDLSIIKKDSNGNPNGYTYFDWQNRGNTTLYSKNYSIVTLTSNSSFGFAMDTNLDIYSEYFKLRIPDYVNSNALLVTILNKALVPDNSITKIEISSEDSNDLFDIDFEYIEVANRGLVDYSQSYAASTFANSTNTLNDLDRPLLGAIKNYIHHNVNSSVSIYSVYDDENEETSEDSDETNYRSITLTSDTSPVEVENFFSSIGYADWSNDTTITDDDGNVIRVDKCRVKNAHHGSQTAYTANTDIYDNDGNYNFFKVNRYKDIVYNDNSTYANALYDYNDIDEITKEKIIELGDITKKFSSDLLKCRINIKNASGNTIFSQECDIYDNTLELTSDDGLGFETDIEYTFEMTVLLCGANILTGNTIAYLMIDEYKSQNVTINDQTIFVDSNFVQDLAIKNITKVVFTSNSECSLRFKLKGLMIFNMSLEYDTSLYTGSDDITELLIRNPLEIENSLDSMYSSSNRQYLYPSCVIMDDDNDELELFDRLVYNSELNGTTNKIRFNFPLNTYHSKVLFYNMDGVLPAPDNNDGCFSISDSFLFIDEKSNPEEVEREIEYTSLNISKFLSTDDDGNIVINNELINGRTYYKAFNFPDENTTDSYFLINMDFFNIKNSNSYNYIEDTNEYKITYNNTYITIKSDSPYIKNYTSNISISNVRFPSEIQIFSANAAQCCSNANDEGYLIFGPLVTNVEEQSFQQNNCHKIIFMNNNSKALYGYYLNTDKKEFISYNFLDGFGFNREYINYSEYYNKDHISSYLYLNNSDDDYLLNENSKIGLYSGKLVFDSYVFCESTNLNKYAESLVFPSNLYSIEIGVFEGTTINKFDFSKCDILISINFFAFAENEYLGRKYYIDITNSDGSFIYENDDNDNGSGTLSDEIEGYVNLPYDSDKSYFSIHANVFNSCYYLKRIHLGNAISLGAGIFYNCHRLMYIDAPEVKYISNSPATHLALTHAEWDTYNEFSCIAIIEGEYYKTYQKYDNTTNSRFRLSRYYLIYNNEEYYFNLYGTGTEYITTYSTLTDSNNNSFTYRSDKGYFGEMTKNLISVDTNTNSGISASIYVCIQNRAFPISNAYPYYGPSETSICEGCYSLLEFNTSTSLKFINSCVFNGLSKIVIVENGNSYYYSFINSKNQIQTIVTSTSTENEYSIIDQIVKVDTDNRYYFEKEPTDDYLNSVEKNQVENIIINDEYIFESTITENDTTNNDGINYSIIKMFSFNFDGNMDEFNDVVKKYNWNSAERYNKFYTDMSRTQYFYKNGVDMQSGLFDENGNYQTLFLNDGMCKITNIHPHISKENTSNLYTSSDNYFTIYNLYDILKEETDTDIDLLSNMKGTLSNFEGITETFNKNYKFAASTSSVIDNYNKVTLSTTDGGDEDDYGIIENRFYFQSIYKENNIITVDDVNSSYGDLRNYFRSIYLIVSNTTEGTDENDDNYIWDIVLSTESYTYNNYQYWNRIFIDLDNTQTEDINFVQRFNEIDILTNSYTNKICECNTYKELNDLIVNNTLSSNDSYASPVSNHFAINSNTNYGDNDVNNITDIYNSNNILYPYLFSEIKVNSDNKSYLDITNEGNFYNFRFMVYIISNDDTYPTYVYPTLFNNSFMIDYIPTYYFDNNYYCDIFFKSGTENSIIDTIMNDWYWTDKTNEYPDMYYLLRTKQDDIQNNIKNKIDVTIKDNSGNIKHLSTGYKINSLKTFYISESGDYIFIVNAYNSAAISNVNKDSSKTDMDMLDTSYNSEVTIKRETEEDDEGNETTVINAYVDDSEEADTTNILGIHLEEVYTKLCDSVTIVNDNKAYYDSVDGRIYYKLNNGYYEACSKNDYDAI